MVIGHILRCQCSDTFDGLPVLHALQSTRAQARNKKLETDYFFHVLLLLLALFAASAFSVLVASRSRLRKTDA